MDDIWDLLSELKNENKNIFKSSKTEEENVCISCYSTNIILEDDNFICKSCNCITSKYIDSQAEWRYYGNDDNKSSDPTRCGAPVNDLLPDSSLGSIISCQMFETQSN